MNEPLAAAPASAKPPHSKRGRILASISLVFLTLGALYALYYYRVARFEEVTDDAYVNGNLVYLNAQVGGTVVSVGADDTQPVTAGQTLVQLDAADGQVALAAAEARLAQTVRQIREQFRAVDTASAVVNQRQTDLTRASADLQRRQQLANTDALSNEEVEHAGAALAAAKDALAVAQKQLAAAQVAVEHTELRSHPAVLQARAEYTQAFLAAQRNQIQAPVDGVVARRTVQVGQRVTPGTNLLAVVPLHALWVDANLKEVQLQNVRIGQPAMVVADLYGGQVVYHGRVEGLAAGTGGAFSLLPPQNAVGNWIKVVQRVPVRIALDPAELEQHPMRIGLSTQVEIDTHNRSGSMAAGQAAQNPALQTKVFDSLLPLAEQSADRIIQREAGTTL